MRVVRGSCGVVVRLVPADSGTKGDLLSKHAFVILAHTDPQLCRRLVDRLADVGTVHLNISGKIPLHGFEDSIARSQLLTPRAVVRWGDWSLVEAVLRLCSQALLDPEVEAVTWVSGQHYLLVDPRRIVEAPPMDRIPLHRVPDACIGKPEWRFRTRFVSAFPPGSRRDVAANALARRLPDLDPEAILGPHRLYGGTAWWSLTRETLTDTLAWLDRENDIRRYFARLCVPDESVFHTAVGAVLTQRAAEAGDPHPDPRTMTRGSTTFVNWSTGRHPDDLDADSIRAAADDGWWFARKFSSDRPDLIEAAEACW